MKPTVTNTLFLLVMLCFTLVGTTMAQPTQFAHNTRVADDGTEIISVYEYTENGEELQRYKECVITYDDAHRPVSRTERLWCAEVHEWVPCRTYTYTYTVDSCIVDLKWENAFKCCKKENQTYAFSMVDARYPEYLLAKMYE